MTYSERWPRQGMTRNGRAYRQALWAPAISGIGGGVLRSPTAQDTRKRGKNSSQRGLSNIEDWLLTPTATDWKGRTNWEAAGRNGPQRLSDFLPTGEATYLNPSFVEEMMGFPVGWTA